MLAKFSVKKPFTVLVAVVLILVLGYVSVTKMTPDLLPEMQFPYIVLFTTYPGASPEEVEATVTKPLEQAMSALDHMKSVTSQSSENISIVYLTFDDSADIDLAAIDVQKALGTVTAGWDEIIGTPILLELSSDLIPVTVAAVHEREMDSLTLSAFVHDTLLPKLEGIPGVASVTTSGLITQQVEIVLDDDKIEALNQKLYDAIDREFEKASEQLDEARQKVQEGETALDENREKLEEGQDALNQGRNQATYQIGKAQNELDAMSKQLEEALKELYAQRDALQAKLDTAPSMRQQLIALKIAVRTLEAAKALLDQSIAAIERDTNLSDEQKEKLIEDIRTSDEYTALERGLARIDEQLAPYGVTRDGIDDAIDQLTEAIPQMEEGLKTLRRRAASLIWKTATRSCRSRSRTRIPS